MSAIFHILFFELSHLSLWEFYLDFNGFGSDVVKLTDLENVGFGANIGYFRLFVRHHLYILYDY